MAKQKDALNNKYLIGDAYCRVDTAREINNVGETYSVYLTKMICFVMNKHDMEVYKIN